MTYRAYEISEKTGQPVELYLFSFGTEAGAHIAYCDKDTAVEHNGILYQPATISREAVVASGGTDKSALGVIVPLNSDIAQLFNPFPPSAGITLTIRGGHYGDPDAEFPVIWSGQAYTCSRASQAPNLAKLTCRPSTVSLSRTGLRVHYQIPCNKVLYGNRCRANKTAATKSTAPTTVAYAAITLPPLWYGHSDPLKFLTGTVEWNGTYGREYRTILSITGPDMNVLALTGPTVGLIAEQPVDVILGCNRQPFGDCRDLHNNIQNFGGCPFMPIANPLRGNPFV